MSESIKLENFQKLSREGIGLIIGPGLTLNGSFEDQLGSKLKASLGCEDIKSSDLLSISDEILDRGGYSDFEVRQEVVSAYSSVNSVSPDLSKIVPARLRCVISLTFDDHFRSRYREYWESKPLASDLVTVANETIRFGDKAIPYFALLGDIGDQREAFRISCSRSDYVSRRSIWSSTMRSLPDCLHGAPLLAIGTAEISERLSDLITAIIQLGPKRPHRLVLLKDDPILNNISLKRILEQNFDVLVLDASILEVGEHVSNGALSIIDLPLFDQSVERLSRFAIKKLERSFAYVPRRIELDPNPEARTRLLDNLFRPSYLDWNPYCLKMQFQRECVPNLSQKIENADLGTTLRVIGESGIGKTVILRTVAFELAQTDDLICFWVRKSGGFQLDSDILDSVKLLNKELHEKEISVIFFLDDPLGARFDESNLTKALSVATFSFKIVVCQRLSESAVQSEGVEGIEMPSKFTDTEKSNFAKYLCELEIADSEDSARSLMRADGLPDAKDVLCNLWSALPQTKAVLTDSISGEYDRLADVQKYVKALVSGIDKDKVQIARRAYEMVTVCSGLGGVGVPVEVLVGGLGIGYEEWAVLCNEGKPVWGLIYDEEAPEIDSWLYRTRNTVVTEVMLKHLNSGGGHSAEFRVLLSLIKACSSGLPPYRRFLHEVLISRRRLIEERFSLEQALELFDSALEVFPRTFSPLEHHRCLCKRALGGDSLEVYDDLIGLMSRTSEEEEEGEAQENLLTSASAAMLQSWKEKKIVGSEAAEAIFRHTSEALAIAPHSLHAVHTQATSLLRIASEEKDITQKEKLLNIGRAAYLTERSLMALKAAHVQSQSEVKSLSLFNDLRDEYLSAYPEKEGMTQELLEAFKSSGDQVFLLIALRMAIGVALKSEKGKAFKKAEDLLFKSQGLLLEKGIDANDEMRICRVQLDFEWKLLRDAGPIEWESFCDDLSVIRMNRRYSKDPFWDFLFAVGKFHLKEFTLAEQVFVQLRHRKMDNHFKRVSRCSYIGNKKSAIVLEGTVSNGAEGWIYLYSPELGVDVRAKSSQFSGPLEVTKFFTIEFSMQGTLAVKHV